MNYQQGNRWTADLSTDQTTLDNRAGQGGSGSGGTTTVVSGGGPNGEDVWEYTILGASSQRYIQIDGFNDVIQSAIGLWVKLPSYPEIQKVFLLFGQGGYTNYFATTITANDLEGSNGWVFIQRPKSQFQTNGSADWANAVTTIRVGVTSEASASGGETAQVGPLYLSLNTRTKVLLFTDDSNATDLTEYHAYINPKGMVATSSTYQDKIGQAGFLTEANLATLAASGWDIVSHSKTEFTYTGTVTATGAVLTDSGADFVAGDLVGAILTNTTTGATATCTENDTTTATGVLSSGGWTTGDGYKINVAQSVQAANMAAIKSYLSALGYSTGKYFVLPGGKFDLNTIAAAQSVGVEALRTTIQFSYNPAISPNLFSFHARATASNILTGTDAENIATLLAELDDAIANKSSIGFFTHRIDAGASGSIHTNKAVFQGFIDGLEERVNAGKCDVVTWSQFIDGLSEDIWQPRTGVSFL